MERGLKSYETVGPLLTVCFLLSLQPQLVAAENEIAKELAQTRVAFASNAELAPLITTAAQRRAVLLGESTHGTSEFYTIRAHISQELIAKHNFTFVALEGDWTAIAHLDRYVRHAPDAPASAREAVMINERWPLWMWANEETVAFAEWLHAFNQDRPIDQRIGIYGIDIYGFWDSMRAVKAFFDEHQADQATQVRENFAMLARFEDNQSDYLRHVYLMNPTAEEPIARVVAKARRTFDNADAEQRRKAFKLYQNARVTQSAELHLRENLRPGPYSWNARARHFEATLHRLLEFYGESSRGIVWAHNTHIGDASATQMSMRREVNIGQLTRQRMGRENVFAIGFGTGTGSVIAAREWNGNPERMTIPLPVENSMEAHMLRLGDSPAYWIMQEPMPAVFMRKIGHRAIGVLFHPERERHNYVPTIFPMRYDGFIFLPRSNALTPLQSPPN